MQRLTSFTSAVDQLEEAVTLNETRGLSELEKGGLVQRFEIAWEPGWRTMADYLVVWEDSGLAMTPGSSIRAAFAAGLIDNRDDWLNAGKLRNVMSHEYDQERRDEGITLVRDKYLSMMKVLRQEMVDRAGNA